MRWTCKVDGSPEIKAVFTVRSLIQLRTLPVRAISLRELT